MLKYNTHYVNSLEQKIKFLKEIYLTITVLLLTLLNAVYSSIYMISQINSFLSETYKLFYLIASYFLFQGFVTYLLCRLGYWKRKFLYSRVAQEELDNFVYTRNFPTVTYLIPSYKEDPIVIKQALLSASLQEYPNKRVVLLIDNPPNPIDIDDINLLRTTRQIVQDIQTLLNSQYEKINSKYMEFVKRQRNGKIDIIQESENLSKLFKETAIWFKEYAEEYREYGLPDHIHNFIGEVLFINIYQYFIQISNSLNNPTEHEIFNEINISALYNKLASFFQANLYVFERKKYINLSHESTKAMNLNSYIALMGKRINFKRNKNKLYIEMNETSELVIPDSKYILILDADSIILPSYTLLMTYFLEQQENQKVALVQTPFCSYPNAPGALEKIVSATTNIQHTILQGSTIYNASYWIGANAMLRKEALHSIMSSKNERGFNIDIYVRDKTVIEDMESTIHFLEKGWKIYNYPETLSYSVVPSDFGAFLIQRKRWATSGIILLPRLLKYLIKSKKNQTIVEGFIRIHEQTSVIVSISNFLFILYFEENVVNLLGVIYSFIISSFLYVRDLKNIEHKITDFFKIYALNLILIPINISGFIQSIKQLAYGKKNSFITTPKQKNITSIPMLFILLEYGLWLYSGIAIFYYIWEGLWFSASYSFFNFICLTYAVPNYIGVPSCLKLIYKVNIKTRFERLFIK